MAFFAILSVRTHSGNTREIFRSDALGYYGYLRAIFITKDLGHEAFQVEYVNETPAGTLNKYFAGEAVMLLPFFLPAHGHAVATGTMGDGYTPPYAHAVMVAALFYALLGLLALRAVLLRLHLPDRLVAALVLVLGFGTQLAQYTAIQPGWSHVYSFFLVCVFLLLTLRLAERPRARFLLAWGGVLGLIVLVRPVNGLVLLAIPVLLGGQARAFVLQLLRRPGHLALAVLAAMAVVAIQPLLWYAQIGSFVAYGYQGEGFLWGRPAIFQVLFGVRRGLFLWTPVLIPAALAVVVLWKKDRVRALSAAVYWAAITYVFSAWWIWYYGSGFGQRVYVEHYPVLIIPLALVLRDLRGRRATLVWAFLAAATALHLAQFWQYNHGYLDRECMDRGKYAYSFLRFGKEHQGRLGGRYVVPPFHPNGLDTLAHIRWEAEAAKPYWRGRRILFDPAYSGWHVVACDTADEFGPSFEMPAKDLPVGRALYLGLGFERYVFHRGDTRDVLVVASTEDGQGRIKQYEAFPMEPLPPTADSTWGHIEYRVMLHPLGPADRVKFFFWNRDRTGRFLADDLDMTVMAARPY